MTEQIKIKTGREIRDNAAGVLATFAKNVASARKTRSAAKHAARGARLRAAEASVRTTKSEPAARPATRGAAGDAEAAKQKKAAAAIAIRNRYTDLRR
jgi:hypothetical protein